MIELNYWYRHANGEDITINASTISLKKVDPNIFKGVKVGGLVSVNLFFKDFWGEGTLYGSLKLRYEGENKVSILPNTYDFDIGADNNHPWFRSVGGFIRNLGTFLGNNAAGAGTGFNINFSKVAYLNFNPNR